MVSKGRPARGRLYNLWSPQGQTDTKGRHAAQSRAQHIHVCAVKEDRLAHALLLHCLPVSMYVYPLARNLATRILLGILMSLCLALSLLLVDIVRRAVVESIKARMNG